MNKRNLCGVLIVFFLVVFACKEKRPPIDLKEKYIESFELISPKAENVKIDNFAHFVIIDFLQNTEVNEVQIKVSLAPEVSMEEPKENLFSLDLRKDKSFSVRKGQEVIKYYIKLNYISLAFDPTDKGWVKRTDFGELPDYLSVYEYKNKLGSKNVNGFIAVADMSKKEMKFALLGELKGLKTPSQFYASSDKPKILLNANYFWQTSALGLMAQAGKTVNPAQTILHRKYETKDTLYYPTRGAFGMTSEGIYRAQWVYTSGNKLYVYPAPSPNKNGEKPQAIPSDKFPAGAELWNPQEAVGAGPLLIKDGKYMNSWEAEMFDDLSGVGPKSNHPRSAIACAGSGHLVFFACEGRNQVTQTPGLTLEEVSNLLLDVGCTEAINLDGGGSTCMLVNGKEVFKPSDNKQRAVATVVAIR